MRRVFVWLLMSMYSVFGFCQMHYTKIGVEPLRMLGGDKRADYPAVKVTKNNRVPIWRLYDDLETQTPDALNLGKMFSVQIEGDSLRFLTSTVLDDAIITPVPSEDDKTHTIWAGDTLFFNIPSIQDVPDGSSLMLWSPGQPTKGKVFKHLTGLLQIPINSSESTNLSKIEVTVDASHAITGMYSVNMNSPALRLTEIAPEYSINIAYDGVASNIYIPVAPGSFKDLVVNFTDSEGNDISTYKYANVIVERGHITVLPHSDKDSGRSNGTYSCQRTKIRKFCVDDSCNDWPEVEETRDPSPVSAFVIFDENATSLFRVSMTGFHWRHVPYQTIYRHYIKSRKELSNEMDVYGNISVNFDSVELFPGHNAFKVGAIAFRKCSSPTIEMSQFVSSKRRVINLYLKTYTCCFDYYQFARSDSLCSYIPDWDAHKWTAPVTAGRWKFISNTGNSIEYRLHPYQRRKDQGYPSDNHWMMPFRNLWDHILINKEGYHIVKLGTVEYQLSSRYFLPDKIHYEETGESKKFTTEIVAVKNYSKKVNGSVEITGIFNEQYIKSFCEDIKFSPEYFNGCERGVIVIDEEKYRGKDGLPHDISKHKHVSAAKSGASWRTSVKVESGKTYLVWTYLIVNNRMFLSRSAKYPDTQGTINQKGEADDYGIFEDWPQKYKPYEAELSELTKEYIRTYREVNGTKGYVPTMKVKHEAEAKLLKRSKEIAQILGEADGDAPPKVKTIRFVTEGNLPYEIVTPVTKGGIMLPYDMFAPDENKPSQGDWSVNLFPVRKGSILKQYPLVFMAYVDFKIKLKRIDSKILQIHAYIPGKGPDGKRLGYVYTIGYASKDGSIGAILLEGKKVGDVVQAGAFIYGWGTPEMLDQMKTIVFTSTDYDKDRREITANIIAKFPKNPLIDWMDEWYDDLKRKQQKN